MVDASCGGTFLRKNEYEAWELYEHLSENSQHEILSCLGTFMQGEIIGEFIKFLKHLIHRKWQMLCLGSLINFYW